MIKQLEEGGNGVLAMELAGQFDAEMMRSFWDHVLDRVKQQEGSLNLLMKIDQLAFVDDSLESFFEEESFVELLQQITGDDCRKLRRVALVGSPEVLDELEEMEAFFSKFWSKRVKEKYYGSESLSEAFAYVNAEDVGDDPEKS